MSKVPRINLLRRVLICVIALLQQTGRDGDREAPLLPCFTVNALIGPTGLEVVCGSASSEHYERAEWAPSIATWNPALLSTAKQCLLPLPSTGRDMSFPASTPCALCPSSTWPLGQGKGKDSNGLISPAPRTCHFQNFVIRIPLN